MNVNALLKDLRIEARLNQQDVADLMHMSRQAISCYERGVCSPTVEMLERFGGLYGLRLEEMLLRLRGPGADSAGQPRTGHGPDIISVSSVPAASGIFRVSDILIEKTSEFQSFMARNHNRIRFSALTEEELHLIFMHSIATDSDRRFVADFLEICAARSGKISRDALIQLP